MKKFTDQELIELYNKNEKFFNSLYDMKCVDLNTEEGTIQFEFNISKKYFSVFRYIIIRR